jgi:hypothetical protein
MANIWSEEYDPLKHPNPMGSEVGCPPGIDRARRAPTLEPHLVTLVRVGGFTFEFHSPEQLRAALLYFRRKILPSSRLSAKEMGSGDHWEFQRWYERLPAELRRESRRHKVVAALEKAAQKMGAVDRDSQAVQPGVAADGAAPRR